MSAVLTRMRRDSGQAMLFMVFALLGLVGMTSLVIDGGSWFRTQRQVQTAADAAALAGAQDLPNTGNANTTAVDYAGQKNGIPAPKVTFPNGVAEIDVIAERPVSGIFMPALNATARAHARAAVTVPLSLKNVGPIAVENTQEKLACKPTPCFNEPTKLSFDDDDITKSKYGLLNLKRSGTVGLAEMKSWVANGYSDALPVNTNYPPVNGDKNGIKNELDGAVANHQILLFPVFDSATWATGFHVIAWAAFVIDSVDKWTGSKHELTGHFVQLFVHDVPAGNPIGGSDDFGVHIITLTQ
jgi:Flp pilus assembly protein TadG